MGSGLITRDVGQRRLEPTLGDPDNDRGEAVAAFGAEMYGLALAITGRVADAEDAYQTAWMNAFAHWDQLQVKAKRRQWLASIQARAAKRTRGRRLLWSLRHPPLDEGASLSEAFTWDPTLAIALSRLTTRQSAVVALHYGQGYSLDEVAQILGCRGGSVRSHLSRALRHLRRSLHDEEA
jgi:RNA polymerase sigma factor (sigma-70 family)